MKFTSLAIAFAVVGTGAVRINYLPVGCDPCLELDTKEEKDACLKKCGYKPIPWLFAQVEAADEDATLAQASALR